MVGVVDWGNEAHDWDRAGASRGLPSIGGEAPTEAPQGQRTALRP